MYTVLRIQNSNALDLYFKPRMYTLHGAQFYEMEVLVLKVHALTESVSQSLSL